MQKRCFKCGVIKDLDDFYGHPQMKDKHLNKCKECTKVDSSMRDPHKLKEYEQKRSKTPERKAALLEGQRRRRKANPGKDSARSKVLRAIKSGILTKGPCEICGNPKTEAHHPDYSKPLEVQWLCQNCHKREHAANRF